MKPQKRIYRSTVSISLFIFGIIVFWGFQAFGAEFSEAQKEIWNLEIKYWESIKNGDVATIKNLLHDNIVSMHSRHYDPINKADQIHKFQYWLSKDKPKSYEIEPLAIQLFNNVAIACFYYKFAGKDFSDSGRVTHTWMKQNDTWYLIGLMEASYESLPMHY